MPPDTGPTPDLLLRPLTVADEHDALAAHRELEAEDFPFLLVAVPGEPWDRFVRRVEDERAGRDLPDGWVPATFLVAEVDGVIVGRVSIRHRLNDHLEQVGGHIGYAVLPGCRGRGYATAMLRHALTVARDVGVDRVLLTCDDDNLGSARVIERCGGVLEDTVAVPGSDVPKRRYWAPTSP
ncbi:GNAT family N-acetyltransferase [Actinotalea sp. K2]|uniref:GNAT family N-acetyltransferase n=1 Tax=Actinotalea sp. K2 TaxID=2939438 RepID=UPI002017D294|nr:GNAT family N-acetyltransferase [Actinotalea sp. K2]MCL3861588.1 GNAT family N-acetyltransferase [Actinotalea sp. K2]